MTPHVAPLAALATALLASALTLASPAPATAGGPGNCDDLDSGRVVVPGKADRTTVTAPAGMLVTGYCVKSAGLRGTTGAPQYVTLATPLATLSLTHTDGGNLTHYSLSLRAVAADPVDPTDPVDPADPSFPPNPPSSPHGFDWNWTYVDPACDALTVAYPSDIPSGQANDVNVRFSSNAGEFTLNFHNNTTTWAGTTGFTYATHPAWPAGVSAYEVTWVQVGGTNYHWQGRVRCVLGDDGDPETLDVPLGVTQVAGFRTGRASVSRGRSAKADLVSVAQAGSESLVLQRRKKGSWVRVAQVATSADGTARVVYPRQNKRGKAKYRLVVSGSESVTGATTGTFVVRTR